MNLNIFPMFVEQLLSMADRDNGQSFTIAAITAIHIYRSIISPPICNNIFKIYRRFVAKEKRVKFVEPLIRRATVSFPDMLRHTLKWTQEIAGGKKH